MVKYTSLNVTTVTETDKAYMAAMLDGEGTITAKKVKYKNYFYSYPVIGVYNTSFKLMQWLITKFGGTVSITKKAGAKSKFGKSKKNVYRWRTNSLDTTIILAMVTPYLVIKNKQAELAMQLNKLNHRANKSRDKTGKFEQMFFVSTLADIECLHRSIRSLNNPEWAKNDMC